MTRHPRRPAPVTLALCALLFLPGCWTKTANEIMTPDPAPASGFISTPGVMKDTHGLAFSRAWSRPGVWFSDYQTIQIAPVDVTHLIEMSDWQKASLQRSDIEPEAQKLGVEMQKKFEDALRKVPDARLRVVDQPGDDTVVVELAIVHLVPSKAWLGTVGLAAWAMGPVGVIPGAAAATANQASLAFEGRVRDASNQSIWGLMADNENAKTRPLNLEAVTWYGHAHEIIDVWAQQFAQIANGPPEVQVEDDQFFTLKPW